jgi:hypothetical protein
MIWDWEIRVFGVWERVRLYWPINPASKLWVTQLGLIVCNTDSDTLAGEA